MKVSAFIRSYRKDFEWLRYCLLSLKRHGSQFHEIVVAVPAQEAPALLVPPHLGVRVVKLQPKHQRGYIDQQHSKCTADLHCSGDYIMHFDSDCVAKQTINLPDFFVGDRPKLLFRPWAEAGDAICWRAITHQALRREPLFETMPAMPFLYPAKAHKAFRTYIQWLYQTDFDAWFAQLPEFSEFNALGNFCHQLLPDAFHFVRATGESDGYPRPFAQFWSHSKIDENLQQLEALIA